MQAGRHPAQDIPRAGNTWMLQECVGGAVFCAHCSLPPPPPTSSVAGLSSAFGMHRNPIPAALELRFGAVTPQGHIRTDVLPVLFAFSCRRR